jgi:S-DNA-T family DNA segregation ATPase FtsK/SpoIIIE
VSTEHNAADQNPNNNDETGLARVHRLPVQRTDDHPEQSGEVLEGDLVSDEEYRALTSQKAKAIARYQGYKNDVVTAVRISKKVATHEHTKTTGKAVLRHALYVPAGAASVGRRLWDAKSSSLYERQKRAAEAAGDTDRLADWEQRAELFKERRHRRAMDWIEAPAKLVKALVIGAASLIGFLLALGIVLAIANKDIADVLGPITALFDLIRWITVAVTVAWGPLVLATPWVIVAWLWNEGRRRSQHTGWLQRLQPRTAGDGGVVVTADGIVRALQNLGVPALNKAFKEDWLPRFELNPVRDGNGFRAVFDLPLGVTPENVADKRPVLARNLYRAEVEVWPSDSGKARDGKAGYVDLWVADSGVLSKPAPEYPLLHAGSADVFAGVPVGASQRGDQVLFPLVEANFVAGGLPGQGKSNLCRVIMLGAALDPLAELWVHVFAGNGDFDAYAPRLARYERGTGDEVTETGLNSLRELAAEVDRRETRLAEIGAKKVTRQLVEKHPDLRPLISLYSECHELFGHKEFGEAAAEYAVQTIKRGRKTGVILGFDTQSSRKEAIPPKLVELVKLNACFAVKTWRSNDGFLGDGSFAAGVRATELRAGRDRGTCLVTGIGEEAFEIVKTHYIEADDDTGYDAAAEVIARAMTTVSRGIPTGATASAPVLEASRDLLEDLDEVLGNEPVPAAKVPALLAHLAPDWSPYQRLTGKGLRDRLAREYGIKVPSTDNKFPIDPITVRQTIAARATSDLDDDS